MEKEYGIQAAYVILSMAIGIYLTIRPLTSYLLRRRLIDLGLWNEQTHKQLAPQEQSPTDMLKWGLILLFTGIGFIINYFIPISAGSSLPVGVIMVSAAIGFLVYYGIVSAQQKNN